ncbi:serine/threonine protein phosphatase [Kouleothrix aurantiaca]|uniref:Serine/threonine protein phosphatase n=1 Tax=Kouleothrix aurantiaca TaxID=186479 RepID=A0A0P9HA11_9CHLR|nr:serine/threonine protein phosphatase [Kouleothrix aurantiaca]
MDRIAIISDIHGNLPALRATLGDIAARGITRIFCLGDLVGKGPHSDQAVDICRAACEATVRGNWDDFILNETDKPTLQWHRQRLGPARLDYLGTLPNVLEFAMSGKRIRLFHASQESVYHRVQMDDSRDIHMAMFTNTPFTGDGPAPDVVGYGDIHSAYAKSFRNRTLFNAGSVGNPLDITQASYAILEGTYGSSAASPFGLQLIRVPYDIERAISDAAALGMPELAAYANELRTARYRGRKVDVE